MTDTDDRKLIADVLEHDRRAKSLLVLQDSVGLGPDRRYDLTAAEESMTAAAPELARRHAALLDALDEVDNDRPLRERQPPQIPSDTIEAIRAAYARNLAKGSKP